MTILSTRSRKNFNRMQQIFKSGHIKVSVSVIKSGCMFIRTFQRLRLTPGFDDTNNVMVLSYLSSYRMVH